MAEAVKSRRGLLALGLIGSFAPLALVPGLGEGLLALLPALLLVVALLLGWHPGERTIARLAARGRHERRRRAPACIASSSRRVTWVGPAGGLLVACAAARRGPPALARLA